MGCGASRTHPYGYAENGDQLAERVAKLDQQLQSLTDTADKLDGRLQRLEAGNGQPARSNGGSGRRLGNSKTKALMHSSGRVCTASEKERADFLESKWLPFVNELRDEMRSSRARAIGGFSPEEILSPQSKMQGWSDRCLELTAEWHGRPNLSVMYEFLVESATLDPSTPYRFTASTRCQRSRCSYGPHLPFVCTAALFIRKCTAPNMANANCFRLQTASKSETSS